MLFSFAGCKSDNKDTTSNDVNKNENVQTSEVGNVLKATTDGRSVKNVLNKFVAKMGYWVMPAGDAKVIKEMSLRSGLMNEGEFKDFNKVCTKAEAALIALRATREWEEYKKGYKLKAEKIKDFNEIPDRYKDAVLRLYSRNCIELDENGKFNALEGISQEFLDDLCEKALDPNKRENTLLTNIKYQPNIYDWQTCENDKDMGVSAVAVSDNKVEGNKANKIEYTFTSGHTYTNFGVNIRTGLDVTKYTGIELSIYVPDGSKRKIASVITDENGEKYNLRNADSLYGDIYSGKAEIPAEKGWHKIRYIFSDMQYANNWAAYGVYDKEKVNSILKVISKFEITISTPESFTGEIKSYILVDDIKFFTADKEEFDFEPLYSDITEENAEFVSYKADLDKAETAESIISVMEKYSPADTKTVEKLTELYKKASNEEKENIKESLAEKYELYKFEDREKSKGFSAAHRALVDIWSKNSGMVSQVISTQLFTNKIHFDTTNTPVLVKGAELIGNLNSDTLKFNLAAYDVEASTNDIVALAKEETFSKVFALPNFRNYVMWVHEKGSEWRNSGYEDGSGAKTTYDQFYELTKHLLTTYNKTGKRFYLGNWEGDWMFQTTDFKFPGSYKINGFIEWYKTRDKAIKDAIKDTPHENVYVYSYLELNSAATNAYGGHVLGNIVLPYRIFSSGVMELPIMTTSSEGIP